MLLSSSHERFFFSFLLVASCCSLAGWFTCFLRPECKMPHLFQLVRYQILFFFSCFQLQRVNRTSYGRESFLLWLWDPIFFSCHRALHPGPLTPLPHNHFQMVSQGTMFHGTFCYKIILKQSVISQSLDWRVSCSKPCWVFWKMWIRSLQGTAVCLCYLKVYAEKWLRYIYKK